MEDINIDSANNALLSGSTVYRMTKRECRMTNLAFTHDAWSIFL